MKRNMTITITALLLTVNFAFGGEVARFWFDGNTNDSSGNGNHGVATGDGVGFVYDVERGGKTAYFEGDVDSYILVSNEPNFDFTDGVTITAWLKADAQSIDWVNIITKFGSYEIVRHWNTGFIGGGVSGAAYSVNWTPVFDEQWHFIAMTYNAATGICSVYVDDTVSSNNLDGSPHTPAPIPQNDSPLRIGGNSMASITGYLNDVRIYDSPLTQQEIDAVKFEASYGCDIFAGDFNYDCAVDVLDLKILADNWLSIFGEKNADYEDFSHLSRDWQSQATQISQSDDIWTMENTELVVTVNSTQGSIDVYDKQAGYRWTQPSVLPGNAFTDFSHNGDEELEFKTQLLTTGSNWVACNVRLIMPAGKRELGIYVNTTNPDTAFNEIDGLEPFSSPNTSGSFLTVADWNAGHMYPTDLPSWPIYNLDWYSADMLQLPWVGVVDIDSGVGYSVTIDTPYDAFLRCIKFGGRRAPLIRWRSEKGKMGYERSLIYNFTSSGSYSALAGKLRSYMEEKGFVKTLSEKAQDNPEILNLYGAAYLWDYFNSMNPTEMYNMGITKAVHHISQYGDPYNINPSNAAAINATKALGWITEEYQSYADAYPCDAQNPTPSMMYDIYPDNFMKDINGNVMLGFYDANGQQYKRCPSVYVQRASEHLTPRLTQYPMSGLYLDVTPVRHLEECWDTHHPRTRRQSQSDFESLMNYISQKPLVLSGENGKWWGVGALDIPMGLMSVLYNPWDGKYFPEYYHQLDFTGDGNNETSLAVWDNYETWGSIGHKHRLPLWHLIFSDSTSAVWYPSDSVDYTAKAEKSTEGEPFPFSYQTKKEVLSILYGSVATFTVIDPGWSAGAWVFDRLAFMRIYRNTSKFHEVIADKRMVSHQFLTSNRDVQKTEWCDGTVVICNFGESDYTATVNLNEYTLKQFGWVVSGPNYYAKRSYDSSLGKEVTEIIQTGNYYFTDKDGKYVAIRKVEDKLLRVNADDIGIPYSIKFNPKNVDADWDMSSTAVYYCNRSTGQRIGSLPFSVSGDYIQTVTFSGWAVLDIVCD